MRQSHRLNFRGGGVELNLKRKKKVLIVGELNVDIIGVGLQTFPVLGREITAQELSLIHI